jgi:hypothetical protein
MALLLVDRVWLHAFRDVAAAEGRRGWSGVAFLIGAWVVTEVAAAIGAAMAGVEPDGRSLITWQLAPLTWWIVVMAGGPDRLIVALLVAPLVSLGLPLIAGHAWAFARRRFSAWRDARQH